MSTNDSSPDRNTRLIVFGSIVAAMISAGGPLLHSYFAPPDAPRQPVMQIASPPPAPVVVAPAPAIVSTSEPPSLRSEHEELVYVTPSGRKYHRGTCRYARTEGVIAMSIADALARGLGACRVCNP